MSFQAYIDETTRAWHPEYCSTELEYLHIILYNRYCNSLFT